MGKNNGFVEILLIILIIVAAIFLGGGLYATRQSAPSTQTMDQNFCKPLPITENSPSIKAPSYSHVKTEPKPGVFESDPNNIFPKINPNDLKTFKLVKAKIPFLIAHSTYFSPNELRSSGPDAGGLKCPNVVVSPDGGAHHHFCQWINDPVVPGPNTSGALKYAVLYPASWSGSPGWSSGFDSPEKQGQQIFYADYQLIFLAYLNSDNTLMTFDGKNKDGNDEKFTMMDVYQQVKNDDKNKPTQDLPKEVLDCKKSIEEGEFTIIDGNTDESVKKVLQLKTFVPSKFDVERNWYYPMCKPAIYLYPKERTEVSVRLAPKGPLTFTLPFYPDEGWNVIANPDGKIEYKNSSYPYLYYEADIPDNLLMNNTDEGFIQPYDNLENFLNVLLPKLGLNESESLEFKKYWLKVLPKSNYYSIKIVPKKVLDDISPLIIEPNPDNIIRVILYFESLEKKIDLNPPVITDFKRSGFIQHQRGAGFTVIEWGGLFKKSPSQNFSCLM